MGAVRKFVSGYISELKKAVDSVSLDSFEDLFIAMIRAYEDGSSVFTMGNGGSGSTASHFACDINKGVCFGLSKRFKVTCLNDNIPVLLAYANDMSYEDIFVEQLKNFLRPNDLVIGISGSGNSCNVVKAIQYANQNNAESIAFTGFDGGELAEIARISIVVPINDMQKIEDVHLILVHMIMQVLYYRLREQLPEGTIHEMKQKQKQRYDSGVVLTEP